MPRHCIFCSKRRLTEEDIWPDWFKRWLRRHPELNSTFKLIRVRGEDTTVLQEKSQSVGGKRAIMCERCNGRRLGPLQDAASQAIKPLLDLSFRKQGHGTPPIPLTPSDQSRIAAWAAMTAMTAEFLPQPMPDVDETYFSQEERIKFRRTKRPLREMKVTTSLYQGRNATGAYFAHSAPHILHPQTGKRTGETAPIYVVTLVLFRVCFQVAFYREPDLRFARNGATLLGIGADPEGITVPIWPVQATQEWPPEYAIDDETLFLYCRRWNPEDESGTESVEQPNPRME